MQPGSDTCDSSCPDGYYNNLGVCELLKFCHSSCGSCTGTDLADKNKCATCSTGLSLDFETLVGKAPCIPDIKDLSTPNIEFVSSIDKDSVIGSGILKSITFNGQKLTAPGTKLS
jgi:hypothetical protein